MTVEEVDITKSSEYEAKRNIIGSTIVVILCLFIISCSCLIFKYINEAETSIFGKVYFALIFFGFCLNIYFYAKILFIPDFCGAKPAISKIMPLFAGGIMFIFAGYIQDNYLQHGQANLPYFLISVLIACSSVFFPFLMYFRDDEKDKDELTLFLKPWIYKRIVVPLNYQLFMDLYNQNNEPYNPYSADNDLENSDNEKDIEDPDSEAINGKDTYESEHDDYNENF